ncbi:hypothetical protein NMY22_g3559 [Coprinellus aureogranulatus]|nr:hypothetical protein NMY22_g3559 [Coprinellus aureogranulatus]
MPGRNSSKSPRKSTSKKKASTFETPLEGVGTVAPGVEHAGTSATLISSPDAIHRSTTARSKSSGNQITSQTSSMPVSSDLDVEVMSAGNPSTSMKKPKVRPDNVHPASLVRLSQSSTVVSSVPIQKPTKFSTYKEALTSDSESSGEESEEEDAPAQLATPAGTLIGPAVGPTADFLGEGVSSETIQSDGEDYENTDVFVEGYNDNRVRSEATISSTDSDPDNLDVISKRASAEVADRKRKRPRTSDVCQQPSSAGAMEFTAPQDRRPLSKKSRSAKLSVLGKTDVIEITDESDTQTANTRKRRAEIPVSLPPTPTPSYGNEVLRKMPVHRTPSTRKHGDSSVHDSRPVSFQPASALPRVDTELTPRKSRVKLDSSRVETTLFPSTPIPRRSRVKPESDDGTSILWSPTPPPPPSSKNKGKGRAIVPAHRATTLSVASDSGVEEEHLHDPPTSDAVDTEFVESGKESWLASMYANEPVLSDVDLIPLHSQAEAPDSLALIPSTIKAAYEHGENSHWVVQRLQSCLSFRAESVFCNPSRWGGVNLLVPSSVAIPRKGTLPSHMCFLTTGIVAYCNLASPATRVYNRVNSRVEEKVVDHRIGIYPFEYEYQRALTYFAHVAGKKTLRYSFSSGVLQFTTKQDGANNEVSTNFSVSPQKSIFHKKPAGPSINARLNPLVDQIKDGRFSASLSYNERVPVFDARSPLVLSKGFDPTSICGLPLLPDDIDVDPNSLVTVGYTANIYVTGPKSITPNVDMLSMNVQFVLLHADPPSNS